MVDGGRVVAFGEELVTLRLLLQRQLRVDVGLSLALLQDLLDLAQLGQRVRRTVFGQRFLVVGTRLLQVVLLPVGRSDTGERSAMGREGRG